MIKIAICDDEKQFIDKLVSTIKEYWEENDIKYEIQAFDNGRQLLDAYESGQKYDIMNEVNYIRANAHMYQPKAYHMRKHMI